VLVSCPGGMPDSHYWLEKYRYFAAVLVVDILHAAAVVVDQVHREFLRDREEDLPAAPLAELVQLH